MSINTASLPEVTSRQWWVKQMLTIAAPVLNALEDGRLKRDMPVYHAPDITDRTMYTYLEALGRTLMGMAPWLNTPAENAAEEALRQSTAATARRAILAGVDPSSPDYMNFSEGYQPIVDAAFLAQGILRAPNELLKPFNADERRMLTAALKATRTRKPYANNWLLFSAIIEVCLMVMGEADWDQMRVDYALRQHMQWYKGDGVYGDGPNLHLDYYNSFVIQPMLCDIIDHVGHVNDDWAQMKPLIKARAARYAGVLERLISPEGTFPIIGRSSCYRFGAMQSLAQAALTDNLPQGLAPAQVRCALESVLRRTVAVRGMFDDHGWLTIGATGNQPGMGEGYISTGSLYLCTAVFLPLGLSESAPFWRDADMPCTQARLWRGDDMPADHCIAN